MARLRHIALSVPDPESTAQFYEKVFGMKRIGTLDHTQASGIYLSDGVINMAVLKYKIDEVVYKEGGKNYVGLHHFGFWVEMRRTGAPNAHAVVVMDQAGWHISDKLVDQPWKIMSVGHREWAYRS